jgi:hypothetical protein
LETLMIRKKLLSPLLIAAALAAFPAWSADTKVVVVGPAEAAPLPPRHERVSAARERAHRTAPRTQNAANPLGATSKVNPLEPSPS